MYTTQAYIPSCIAGVTTYQESISVFLFVRLICLTYDREGSLYTIEGAVVLQF